MQINCNAQHQLPGYHLNFSYLDVFGRLFMICWCWTNESTGQCMTGNKRGARLLPWVSSFEAKWCPILVFPGIVCMCVCAHAHVYGQVYTKAGGQCPVSSSIASHLIRAANPSFCWLICPEVCLDNDLSIQSRYCSKLTTAPHPASLGSLRWAHIRNSEYPA